VSGVVYFIQAGRGGHIKIGRAESLAAAKNRVGTLQTGNHKKLSLLAVSSVSSGSASSAERAAHVAFAGSRLQGEWFRPTRALLDAIEMIRYGGELYEALGGPGPVVDNT